MKYKVKIENFEGPFDLLLTLVSKQKLDIGAISITDIIDQYLAEVAHMQQVDLNLASDFMLVAATLLKIKTDMLLKLEPEEVDEDIENLSPSEAREMLISKLTVYKQFKDASIALKARADLQSKLIPRLTGPDPEFLGLIPDFLENVSLEELGESCANALARRDEFLLDAQHIASKPIPVVTYVRTIHTRLVNKKKMNFSDLIDKDATTEVVVVNFLALLELYKHNYVEIKQVDRDIKIKYIEGSGELDISEDEIEELG
ncbi:MAG: segregation/condensation protein A [Coriobacteriia bacterium]|nr:segregation/condensation protein A [Coriobacteriia bacterium]